MRTATILSISISISVELAGCIGDERGTASGGGILTAGLDGDETGDGGDDGDDGDFRLDALGEEEGGPPCSEGGDCESECEVPEHVACDSGTDPLQAIGLNCPGELPIDGDVAAAPEAVGVVAGLGNTGEWDPTEGGRSLVLGTGVVADLAKETPNGDVSASPTHCNDDLGSIWDVGTTLPAPLRPVNVGGDCDQNPSLIGTGDCSNSIQEQFQQGISANDYAELRLDVTVPAGSNSFSYDLAFFSTEYPFYYFSEFNDMYVGWLESERWTGNVSFDKQGNPISLNASFLDFMDTGSNLPELAGTCMKGHAATTWLTTTAPVSPGEKVTIVFAIFDLSDSILDSYVLLDDFRWGCEGDQPPNTVPQG
jgi:hypothetical protein